MAVVKRRRSTYGANPWAKRIKRGINIASNLANSYLAYRTQLASQQTSSPGVTKNYDVKRQYRYKRMPKYKRRRWARFSKKVRAVMDKQIGTTTQLLNSSISISPTNLLPQAFGAAWMFGKNGTNTSGEVGCQDLNYLFDSNNPGTMDNVKLGVSSAILDVTMQNTGTTSMEVDVYDVVLTNESKNSNLGACHTLAQANTATIGAGTAIKLEDRGATLFDMPQLIKICGMKILKKTKFFLSSNDTATYQIRNARNYTFNQLEIADGQSLGAGGFVQPYKTRGLIFIAKNTPKDAATTGTLTVGCTRKYAVKVFESKGFVSRTN